MPVEILGAAGEDGRYFGRLGNDPVFNGFGDRCRKKNGGRSRRPVHRNHESCARRRRAFV